MFQSSGGGGKIDTYYNLVPSIILTMKDSSVIKLYGIKKVNAIELETFNPYANHHNIIKMELSNGVNEIEDLIGCGNLKTIHIPDSVTHIEESAFNGTNVSNLKIIGKKDISNLLPANLTDNLTNLYVDSSLVETYKTYRDSIGKTFEVKPLT